MTAEQLRPRPARDGSATAQELRMALHALATVVAGPQPPDPARTEQLLRTVIDTGRRSLRHGPLPVRPFEYEGEKRRLIGPGALLADYLDPASADSGSAAPASLSAGLDGELLGELCDLLTAGEDEAPGTAPGEYEEPPAHIPEQRTGSPDTPATVQLLLEPVADWTVTTRAGVVFGSGADDSPRPGYSAVRAAWSALPPAVVGEIERALDVTRGFIADLGRPQPPRVTADLDPDGVLNPSVVAPGACAAALALGYLAREAELPTPTALRVLPVAGCSDDGAWTVYPRLGGIHEPVAADGTGILWRDEDGWRIRTGGEVRADADPSLAGAARLLWGESWDDARRRWARDTLATHQWEILHPAASAADGTDWLRGDGHPLVELEHTGWLADRFAERPLAGVIQSGTRNSGKSVCARQLTARLEAAGWRTVVISPTRHQLPDPDDLPRIVRAALWATDTDSGGRTLVVLEDLYAIGGGDIGQALSSLRRLKIGVLALTRYVGGATTDWDNHGVTAYVTQVRNEDRRALADRLVAEHPEVYGLPGEERISLAVEACQGDLRVLTDLLRADAEEMAPGETAAGQAEGADGGPAAAPEPDGAVASVPAQRSSGPGRTGGAAEGLLRRQAARVRGTLGPDEISAVRMLAAVSMLDEAVPDAYVSTLSGTARRSLGVASSGGLTQIASRVRAEAVLAEFSPSGTGGLLAHTEEYLVRLLADDHQERVRALIVNCATYSPERLSELLDRPALRAAVIDWASRAHPPTALGLLRLCKKHNEPTWIAAALPGVIARIPDTPALTVSELTTALKVLWDFQYWLPDPSVTSTLFTWAGTGGGLDAVLGRASTISERYGLSRALLRLAGDDTAPPETVCSWLESRADALIRAADPRSQSDLSHIRRLDNELFHRTREAWDAAEPEPRVYRSPPRPLLKPAQELLSHHPTHDTPLGAVLSWMALRLHFDGGADWNSLIQSYEGQIRSGLARADAIQISTALADLARINRGLCNRLLNRLRPARLLALTLKAASPAEAAILIDTVRNIHGATVKSLLYRTSGTGLVADAGLVRDLARTVDSLDDGRGAGMLLSAASRADDLYRDTKEGFAYRLSRELGADFARRILENERRPSVAYHLLHGLWEAGADYRGDLEEHALRLVVSSLRAQRGAARPWGPRLAMLLIEDDYFGQDFLARLAGLLESQLLCSRMVNPGIDPQSMVYTHRLALAIDPGIGKEFGRRISLDRAVQGMISDHASHVAQKLRIIAETLRTGGHRDATAIVLKELSRADPGRDWAKLIRDSRRTGSFTDTLTNLRKLDPSAAAVAVERLTHDNGQKLTDAQDRLVSSVIEPALTADLLSALDKCVPGTGRKSLESLRAMGSRWRTFREIFGHEQDPILQGNIGRRLAPMGLMPREERISWMKNLVNSRWAVTLPLMAGPRAIEEVLTLSYVWEPLWGEQLAACIDDGKLFRRLDLAMRPDLRVLPRLITIMRLTGRQDIVDRIADLLASKEPRILAESLGLGDGVRLLRSLHHADEPVDLFAPALGELLAKTADRALVVNPRGHWATIGWAAQLLTETGYGHCVPDTPPALAPNTVPHAAAISWAATWLPAGDWSRRALEESLAEVERAGVDPWHPQETGMALIAAARSGRLPSDAPLDPLWYSATGGTPDLLTLLCREALKTPPVREYLATPPVADQLRAVVSAPGAGVRLCRQELSSLVSRLCPEVEPEERAGGTLDI
ncbi:hypothetical protein [Streptomyces sp. CAU 1734]|uniref:hypothetical protein n=1 Tax=Streptomyces sp. CAU 1734 TaxID=3140360 RepID=UPI00326148DC